MIIEFQDKQLLKRLLLLFKPFIKKIIAILTLLCASVGLNLFMPIISKQIMDKGLLQKNFYVIIQMVIIGFFLLILDQVFGLIETKYRTYINSIMSYTLTKDAFKHTLKLKMQYLNNKNFAEIMNNIAMDAANISRISDRSIFIIVSSVFRMIGGVIGLLLIDWKLTALVLGIIPARFLLVKYLAKKRKLLFEKFMQYNENYYTWYGDTISGVKEIKLWGLDRLKTGQFTKKQRNIIRINIQLAFMDKINEFSESVIFNIIINSLYIIGAHMLIKGEISIGGLFAFITYSGYVTAPISAILNIGYNFSNVIPSAKRYFDFMDMENEGCIAGERTLSTYVNKVIGRIEFKDVSFSYKNAEPVLKSISIEINPGERVAIIGANGSGKSTIINLLLRFYNPDSGTIMLDGIDISNIKLRDYRAAISVVSQELYLFDTSIKENIRLISHNDEMRFLKVARESGAHDFIETLPDKYESKTGRNGAMLSGGEKQKIAVARALIKDSRILILDEATSNYDIRSEGMLNDIIESNYKDKTLIVVTHRTDILKKMDKIIMLENGCISDVGKHEELSSRNVFYNSIINRNEEKSV